jgi:hypothetical protein
MKIAIIILVYIVGYALSYYLLMKLILKEFDYTRGDMKLNLVFSLLSWGSVIAVVIKTLLEIALDDDKIIKKKK